MSVSAEMKFSEAIVGLDMRDAGASRARYLKPRTLKTYRLELDALTLFFGETRLCDITKKASESIGDLGQSNTYVV